MIDFFLLAILFIISLIATYEDIKIGKVRNKLIIFGLLGGVLGYLSLVVDVRVFSTIKFIYFKKVLINVSVSWLVAVFIWYVGLWSAGDAKLFMLASFLLPLKYYGENLPIPFCPSAILLINTFIFVLLFVLFDTFFRIILATFNFILNFRMRKENVIKKISDLPDKINSIKVNRIKYLKLGVTYLCFFMLMHIFKLHLRKESIGVWSVLEKFWFIGMFFIFKPLRRFLKKMKMRLLCFLVAFLFIYILFLVSISSQQYLLVLGSIFKGFAGFTLITPLVFTAIRFFIKTKEVVKVSLKKVYPNMLLSEESIKELSEYLKKKGLKEKFYADGLTPQQVEYLKELSLKESSFREINVYKTFPLAPFIFLGVFSTILAKGLVFDLSKVSYIFRMVLGRFL